MKSVIILDANIVKCPQFSICVEHDFTDYQKLIDFLQLASPRFTVSARRWQKGLDGECVDLYAALYAVKHAVLTYVDKYNYEEIDTWHQVEDGVFDYMKFKQGKCKVSNGKLYQLKKEFQKCPLRYTIKNIEGSDWKTIERI